MAASPSVYHAQRAVHAQQPHPLVCLVVGQAAPALVYSHLPGNVFQPELALVQRNVQAATHFVRHNGDPLCLDHAQHHAEVFVEVVHEVQANDGGLGASGCQVALHGALLAFSGSRVDCEALVSLVSQADQSAAARDAGVGGVQIGVEEVLDERVGLDEVFEL